MLPKLTIFALLLSVGLGTANARQVALTFDDLPGLTQYKSQAYLTDANARLLRGLRRHHLPAIGFVNEGKLDELERAEQIAILTMWLDAGMTLGNHSFSHLSPNKIGADAYISDIIRGETVTNSLLSERGEGKLRWFRHPYLETGSPSVTKEKINIWLDQHGYRIAPVTMENSDWMFSEPYDDAIAHHDQAHAVQIRASYLRYTRRTIGWYRKAAKQLLGREPAYVFLLHATRLNADCIDEIAASLRHNGLHGVSLETATRDPAYRMADNYAGRDGIDWLERWSIALGRDLPWDSFAEPPTDIQAAYERVDDDN